MTFLDEVRKKLDLPPAEKEQVMRELESHYHEVEDEALNAGMNECEAATEAAKRLGDPSDIAQRMQTVHTHASWKTAILTALPFLGFAITYIIAILHVRQGVHHPFDFVKALVSTLLCTVLIMGSVRELKADRRPLWLATWLPMGFILLLYLIVMFGRRLIPALHEDHFATQGQRLVIIQMGLRNSIEMLLLGSMSVWIYRHLIKWKRVIIDITVIGTIANILVAYMVYTHINMTNLLYLIHLLFFSIIIMLLAIGLFVRHPYGDKIQASIMLYSFMMPGVPANLIGGNSLIYMLLIMHIVVSGLAIMAASRASKWQVKQWILCSAIIIDSLMVDVISLFMSYAPNGVMLICVSLVNAIFSLVWIVFVPELIDRYNKKRRPEFVQ